MLLAEGDPLFYGSSMYLVDRLKERFETEMVPGVPAFAAATAGLAQPLVRQTDVLTVLAGTLPEAELARRLADTDGAIIMKLGRTFPAVRSALAQAGRLDGAMYVERASMPEERWLPVADVDPASVPYFSLIVVPGDSAAVSSNERMRPGGALVSRLAALGPQPAAPLSCWWSGSAPARTAGSPPEAADALASVDHVVGYAPYVNRVPAARRTPAARVGQHRRGRPSQVRARPGPGRRDGSRSCPAAMRASSAWRRRSSRRRRTSGTPTSRSGCSPGSAPSRPSPPARARRSARTSPWSACPTGSSRGR